MSKLVQPIAKLLRLLRRKARQIQPSSLKLLHGSALCLSSKRVSANHGELHPLPNHKEMQERARRTKRIRKTAKKQVARTQSKQPKMRDLLPDKLKQQQRMSSKRIQTIHQPINSEILSSTDRNATLKSDSQRSSLTSRTLMRNWLTKLWS